MMDVTSTTTNTGVSLYLVGGAVRDLCMGRTPKDFDFTVTAPSYVEMKNALLSKGFHIFLETPEYLTIRASRKAPWTFAGLDLTGKTFDFVLARRDGKYSDARRPDTVEPGTIFDDLARRDFTINAIALTSTGEYIDPHEGRADISARVIRCVGGIERLFEDGLRMLRALRFEIQLGFGMAPSVTEVLKDPDNLRHLDNVSMDRVRAELDKCFRADSLETLWLLGHFPALRDYLFGNEDLWLQPTLKKR